MMVPRVHQMLFQRSSVLAAFCRSSHLGSKDLETLKIVQTQNIHGTACVSYPKAKDIPLPTNVEDINAIETGRFSPQRARDITGDVILTQNAPSSSVAKQDLSADSFLQSYDCTGTVSLNSAMQTNVPDPYAAKAPSHLNMPGGEWGRSDKYVAQDLQNSHYTNVKENDLGARAKTNLLRKEGTYPHLQSFRSYFQIRHFSSAVDTSQNSNGDQKEDRKTQLKRAFKDYGATVIVFHVGISLISLGGCYLAVISGLDLYTMTGSSPFPDVSTEVAGEVGKFVIAYAIHKMFAPVRISITLFSTPFIVRYLRKVGILKRP